MYLYKKSYQYDVNGEYWYIVLGTDWKVLGTDL